MPLQAFEIQPLFRTPEETQKEADFIESVLKVRPPAQILDVPCGEGRLSIELASRGYKMSGIDITAEFLRQAKEKAGKMGLDITWHQDDMRKIQWQDKFDAAFCMWGSFGYFDDRGNTEFIKAVRCALRRGGRFLLDIHIAETIFPIYQPKWWDKIGDIVVLGDRYFDHATGRIDEDWIFIHQGKQSTCHSSIRIYTYRELIELLKRCGFTHCEAFGTLSKDPVKFGAKRLLMVARKSE